MNSPCNSLSRDHLPRIIYRAWESDVTGFQLPLSGSRLYQAATYARALDMQTFNSLSRDHKEEYLIQIKCFPDLSTPSLGITDWSKHHWPTSVNPPFNSLSRDHWGRYKTRNWYSRHFFQLPLSGSPMVIAIAVTAVCGLSFQLPLSGSRNLRGNF